MITMYQWLEAQGLPTAGDHECEVCGKTYDSFCIVRLVDDGPWTCGMCVTDAHRVAQAAIEAANRVPDSSWNSDYGASLKAQRNIRLDDSRWTIMPDSPLTLANQAQWLAYLRTLQNMTRDTATTTAWTWPTPPAYAYPPIVVVANVASNSASVSLKANQK